MGSWDPYCGICGGPPNLVLKDPNISEQDALWVQRLRLFGWKKLEDDYEFNYLKDDYTPDSLPPEFGAGKCDKSFISGVGVYNHFDEVKVPADPSEEYHENGPDVATWGIQVSFARRIVLHDNCWILLQKALAYVKETKYPHIYDGRISLDSLAEYINSQRIEAETEFNHFCTQFDFGERVCSVMHNRFWEPRTTGEDDWLLMDFLNSSEVEDFCQQFILNAPPGDEGVKPVLQKRLVETQIQPSQDVVSPKSYLENLPSEIISSIFCYLPRSDIINFRLASRHVARAFLTQEFWKHRCISYLPYLFEIGKFPVGTKVDWRGLYRELSSRLPKESKDLMAWRNRRRVWRIVLHIAKESWPIELEARAGREDTENLTMIGE